MHPDPIATAYDQLAEQWLDDRFNPHDGMHAHRHALAFLPAGPGGWALNAGCGCSTRFSALFREHGLQVECVDISARMVALARTADPAAIIHHDDLCTWPAPRSYRFISAWDSIWHVPLQRQRDLMLKLTGLLEPGGLLIFTAGGLDAPSEHTDATMGPRMYYATLGIPGLLAVIAEAGCTLRHLAFDQLPERHLVVIAQRIG
jgi:SAM-dependent methyltransferase